jgi:hypothetical protein
MRIPDPTHGKALISRWTHWHPVGWAIKYVIGVANLVEDLPGGIQKRLATFESIRFEPSLSKA